MRQHPVFWFLSDWKLLPLLSTFPKNPTFIKLITFGTSSFLLLDMLIAFDKEHLKIQVVTQNLWKSEWQLECGRWETRQAWRLPSASMCSHAYIALSKNITSIQIHKSTSHFIRLKVENTAISWHHTLSLLCQKNIHFTFHSLQSCEYVERLFAALSACSIPTLVSQAVTIRSTFQFDEME